MATKKVTVPDDAIVIDLNESRRARVEAETAKPVFVKFGKRTYKINREIPLVLIVKLGTVDDKDPSAGANLAIDTVKAFLGDDGWQQFMDDGATVADMFAMFTAAFQAVTGTTLGEAGASDSSSPNTGTQPRQRSKRVTASTS